MKTIIFLACFFSGIAYGQDTLSKIKSSRNVVTIEASDNYSPFIYLNDSVVVRKTVSEIASLYKTGWTESEIYKLTKIFPLRTSLKYISNSILPNNYAVRYQPYGRDPELYDWIELAYKNSKLREPEMFNQAKKINGNVLPEAFEPWVLIIINRSSGYTEAEMRKELKKRKIDRVYFDIRGKAIESFDERYSFGDAPAPPPPPPPTRSEILTIVDEQASFPGGKDALFAYLAKNLVYPQGAKDAGIEGKAFLKFVVNEDGSISNISIAKKVHNCLDCDKEALRLVKSMPKWIPGKIKGKAVSSYFNLPVEFRLSN